MGCQIANSKKNYLVFKILICFIIFFLIFFSSKNLFANKQQPIKESNKFEFNILLKFDSEIDSAQERVKKQIIGILDKEFKNSLSTEQINILSTEHSFKNVVQDLFQFDENRSDLIINLQISRLNPLPVVETSFILKDEKISGCFPSNFQFQSFQYDSLQANNFKELIDCLRMIYYIKVASNLNDEQRFEEAINSLVEINDEIYPSNFESIKYHFLGNIYLVESARVKNQPFKHEDYLSQAKSQFIKSIEKNPYYAQSHFALGYIYAVEQFDFNKAEDYFKKAVEIDESSFEYNWNLALAYIENDKNELAKNTLINFMKKNSQNLVDSKMIAMNELLKSW